MCVCVREIQRTTFAPKVENCQNVLEVVFSCRRAEARALLFLSLDIRSRITRSSHRTTLYRRARACFGVANA